MAKTIKKVAVGLAVLLLAAGAGYGWLSYTTGQKLSRAYTAHTVDLPVPMPLSEAELATLREERLAELKAAETDPNADGDPVDPLAGVDLAALAKERAVARGKHLVESRFVCIECHGKDFGGGVMVDDPAIGRFFGPNLTRGKGSVVEKYTIADWDRIVRHGIRADGKPAVMPSEDFVAMSDRELSDIVAYISTVPPVDRTMPAPTFGPVGTVLMATGKMILSADRVQDHNAAHAAEPPPEAPSVELGGHIAQTCTGCHGATLAGGPIASGPPDWPPASNLTPHADGLSSWTYEQFAAVMRTGKRPDGTELKMPMASIVPYAAKMKDVEMQAIWAYLRSLPAAPGN